MKNEHEICEHCGAKVTAYWHKLTPGLVRALIKSLEVVKSKGVNEFSKNELNLGHSEYGNFQKLRFHALIAKDKDSEGNWIRGNWLITRRGASFLKGNESVPSKVKTFRNKVVDHSPDLVTIRDVIDSQEFWQIDYPGEVFDPGQKALL